MHVEGRPADDLEHIGGLMRDLLAARGLVDGPDIRLDVRHAEGKIERLPELAESLVRDGAAVIVAFGPAATRAAGAATSTIPIVAGADLVSEGLVANMTRPAGNMTGVSLFNLELDSKRIEALKQVLPDVQHVGVLNDATMTGACSLARHGRGGKKAWCQAHHRRCERSS